MSQVELIRVSSVGSEKTVSVSPDHLNNIKTARQIAWQMGELLSSQASQESDGDGGRLNLNFSNIDRLNSEGLNELIGINAQARSQGVQLVLLDVQETVRQVFEVTRLERMFEFASSPLNA